ncbi:hypothetical protein D3C75_858180 [compost metagenome]
MLLAQAPQSRHQPAAGEGRRRVDVQTVGMSFLLDAAHRQLDLVERLVQRPQQYPAGAGQFEVMVTALQQVFAQLLFQLPHLATDRALGDVEQFGGTGEAACATGHFERFERIQAGHFAFHERLSRTSDRAQGSHDGDTFSYRIFSVTCVRGRFQWIFNRLFIAAQIARLAGISNKNNRELPHALPCFPALESFVPRSTLHLCGPCHGRASHRQPGPWRRGAGPLGLRPGSRHPEIRPGHRIPQRQVQLRHLDR